MQQPVLPAVEPAPAPRSYRWRAWGAVAALIGFLAAYFGLAGWFGWTAWRLGRSAFAGRDDALWAVLVAACAALLALFMLKALFFRQRRGEDHSLPVTPAEQPQLFAELHDQLRASGELYRPLARAAEDDDHAGWGRARK